MKLDKQKIIDIAYYVFEKKSDEILDVLGLNIDEVESVKKLVDTFKAFKQSPLENIDTKTRLNLVSRSLDVVERLGPVVLPQSEISFVGTNGTQQDKIKLKEAVSIFENNIISRIKELDKESTVLSRRFDNNKDAILKVSIIE